MKVRNTSSIQNHYGVHERRKVMPQRCSKSAVGGNELGRGRSLRLPGMLNERKGKLRRYLSPK
jgi:hypothetical protein